MEFFNTNVSKKSKENVVKTLESTYLSEGKQVKLFEELLNKKLGLINPVALNSGTSALHLALVLAGVDEGDQVIIPPQTFIATGMAVLYQRAIPVFADIKLETGNINTNSILKKITKKTKAIIPVHWGGYPCDLGEINEIAREYNLTVIEDAAHALGAKYNGKPIGSISKFTCFSFQAIKHLTTGDGGALCCISKKDELEAKRRRWFDIDRINSKPSILGEREYNATGIGYKYHMNDISASIGIGNLEDYNKNLLRVRKIASLYRKELENIDGLKLLESKPDRESSYWLFTILVERRNDFIRALKSRKVPSSVVHLRIDKNSIFGGIKRDLVQMDEFNEKQVSIPVHNGLKDDEVNKIIESIKEGW